MSVCNCVCNTLITTRSGPKIPAAAHWRGRCFGLDFGKSGSLFVVRIPGNSFVVRIPGNSFVVRIPRSLFVVRIPGN